MPRTRTRRIALGCLVAVLALSACGGGSSNKSKSSGGSGTSGDDFASLVAQQAKAKIRVTYQSGTDDPFTISQDGNGNVAYITKDSVVITKDGTTTSCSGLPDNVECTSLSGDAAKAATLGYTAILSAATGYINAAARSQRVRQGELRNDRRPRRQVRHDHDRFRARQARRCHRGCRGAPRPTRVTKRVSTSRRASCCRGRSWAIRVATRRRSSRPLSANPRTPTSCRRPRPRPPGDTTGDTTGDTSGDTSTTSGGETSTTACAAPITLPAGITLPNGVTLPCP